MKYGKSGGLIVEKQDQCAKCLYFNPDVICALIQAIHDSIVYFESPFKVQACPQFEPVLNPLTLIKKGE